MEGKFSKLSKFRESDISLKVIFSQVYVILFRGSHVIIAHDTLDFTIRDSSPGTARGPPALALLTPLYSYSLPGPGSVLPAVNL